MAEIDICNRALYRIGHTEKVTAIDGSDTTQSAVLCTDLYSKVRDELLATFDWRFAKLVAVLAEDATIDRPDWTYAYALPSDCLAPREIWSGLRLSAAEDRIPFETQSNAAKTAQLLFCDVEPVTTGDTVDQAPQLKYTARITDTGAFPALFADALAWALAAELAMPLSASERMANRAAQMAALSLQDAMAWDSRGQQLDPKPTNEFVSARR